MSNTQVLILLLGFIIDQAISQNIRSLYLTQLVNTQYECNSSNCSLSILISSSDLVSCRIACLSNEQCQTATFNRNNNQCNIFADIASQYGTLSSHFNVTTMIANNRTQFSATTISTTTTSSTTSTTTTSSTTSTTTTSSTTSTTTTTTTTTTVQSPNPCGSGGLLWNKTGITILSSPQVYGVVGIYIDANNTMYIADETNAVIWKLSSNTSVPTIVAGTYGIMSSDNNEFYYPQDVYIDKKGNMYVSDSINNRIQKFINGSLNGITIAGSSTGDSGSTLNKLDTQEFLSFDDTETYVYIADTNNQRIMRYFTNSSLGTNGVNVAGGTQGNTNTKLNTPFGVAYKSSISNDLFITNYDGHSVIRWTLGNSSGTFIAGIPGTSGSNATSLNSPSAIKLDNYLNVFVTDSGNNRIQLFCANSSVGITIAGTGTSGSGSMQLNNPLGFAFDSAMNLYVADRSNHRIQKFMKLT